MSLEPKLDNFNGFHRKTFSPENDQTRIYVHFLHLSAKAFSIYWSLTTRIGIQCLVICIDFPRRENAFTRNVSGKENSPREHKRIISLIMIKIRNDELRGQHRSWLLNLNCLIRSLSPANVRQEARVLGRLCAQVFGLGHVK